jgi:hypothetical protein
MSQNKLLRVVQAHLLGFSTGIMFSGNAFACSACFKRLFSSSVAWSNWSIPNFPTASYIGPYGRQQLVLKDASTIVTPCRVRNWLCHVAALLFVVASNRVCTCAKLSSCPIRLQAGLLPRARACS